MDDFKLINTLFGHNGGDDALRYIGKRLRDLKGSNPGYLVGRLGGDEFAIVVASDKEEVLRELSRWHQGTQDEAQHANLGGIARYVKLSIGVVHYAAQKNVVSPQDEFEILLDRADRLGFEAKAEGKNGILSADQAIRDAWSEKDALDAQTGRLLMRALKWPALQDVVSWEVVETRRLLVLFRETGHAETALRDRRRHRILLDRRIVEVQRQLREVDRRLKDRLEDPSREEGPGAPDRVTEVGRGLCRMIMGALLWGIRPSFREGALKQLDLFIEKLNRFVVILDGLESLGKEGSRDRKKELNKQLLTLSGPGTSRFSEVDEVLDRIPGGYEEWKGIRSLIEREKVAADMILRHQESQLDAHHHQLAHLDRKCCILEQMLQDAERALEILANADELGSAGESGRIVRLERIDVAKRILDQVVEQMINFESQRMLPDANALVSEHITHVGVLADLVRGIRYESPGSELRRVASHYGFYY